MNKLQFILEDFKHNQDLIKFTDQKASILIFLYGFILKAVFDYSTKLVIVNPARFNSLNVTFLSGLVFVLGGALAIILILQSYYILYKIIRPRLSKYTAVTSYSVFYFEHIARLNAKEFIKKFDGITEAEMEEELLEQLHQLAKILTQKTKYLRIVVSLFFISMVLMALFIFSSSMLRT